MTARRQQDTNRDAVFSRIGAAEARRGRTRVVLVPGELVPVVALELPDGVRGLQRERIAARQLRDLMALSPEAVEMRPVRDAAAPKTWSRVMIVDKDRVLEWRRKAGPGCRAVIPDYLSLPAAGDLWTVACHDGMVLARMGTLDGFSMEPGPARLILERELAGAPPRAILKPGELPPEIDEVLAGSGIPVIETAEEAERHGLAVPRVLAHGELDRDLRQDPQQEQRRLRRLVLPWRWPVLASIVALGVWSAAAIIETGRLERQAADIRAETVEEVRARFVRDGPIPDVRAQVGADLDRLRDRVRKRRQQSSPLDLINRAAVVMAGGDARVEEITMDQGGRLTVLLELPDYGAQDAIEDALRSAGLGVDVVESGLGENGDRVRAEIALTLVEGKR